MKKKSSKKSLEIEANNKLIAEFMNGNVKKGGIVDINPNFAPSNIEGYNITNSRYNSSWDWLMPVVEKIESEGYFVDVKTKMCSISRDNKGNSDSYLVKAIFGDDSKIQKLYDCVVSTVKFIIYKK
jgi:hypothetical protein